MVLFFNVKCKMENVDFFVRSEGKAQGEGKRLVCSLHLAEFRKAQGKRIEVSFQSFISLEHPKGHKGVLKRVP
jgi:nitrite reductase/ring-hydroxylating ferredoxin subunit